MSNERIKNLKEIAKRVDGALSQEEQVLLLSKGFDLFSEETAHLENSFSTLHDQFRTVNKKLEETNERLQHKVKELHVLTNYLDKILSHMNQGLIFIDHEGYVTTYNKAAEAILEIPRETILYEKFETSLKDDTFGFSINSALKEKEGHKNLVATLKLKEGLVKEVEVSVSIIPSSEKEETPFDYTHGLIILIRDITDLKKFQEIANRSDRMKALGEMAAVVAHEIRNPLGGIKGFASLLERDLEKEPEKLKFVKYILEGANSLDRLVGNILNYTRPLKLNQKNSDIKTLIEELIASLKAEKLLTDSINFKLLEMNKIDLNIDVDLFKSALKNLMLNAIQAMPEGGDLTITLEKSQGKNIITITDTGVGIEEENLKKLFSPFFTTKPTGNGLGLAEVHKVISAHGGEISVSSTPKIGTSFMIKI